MTVGRRTFLSSAAAGLAFAAAPLKSLASAQDTDRALRVASRKGLVARLPAERRAAAYHQRLRAEINVITRLGLSKHFTFAHDLVAAARKRGIPVFAGLCGASASLVCWTLGLSEVDPVEHDLPFETFINWRRPGSAPYFEVAVCARRQHELRQILAEQWGADRVAFGHFDGDPAKYALLAVFTESGAEAQAVELLEGRPDRDTRLSLRQLLARDAGLRLQLEADPSLRQVVRVALDLAQNMATSCGPDSVPGASLVVSPDGPLASVSEQVVRKRREPVVAVHRRYAENVGLLAIDCPPLPALTAIASARVPISDPDDRVWDMIGAGDTEGIVGLESNIHDFLRRARPRSLADLAAVFAVFRPGPIECGMADLLVERMRGGTTHRAPHPLIEKAAIGSHGVLLFKEQFMRLTHAVAGFELADADLMRRALGKKHEDEIEYWGARFADAAVHHGVDRGTSRQIVEHLEMFSGYLFSEACALAMATLSLRMATFKTHAPAEFARAVRAYREGG